MRSSFFIVSKVAYTLVARVLFSINMYRIVFCHKYFQGFSAACLAAVLGPLFCRRLALFSSLPRMTWHVNFGRFLFGFGSSVCVTPVMMYVCAYHPTSGSPPSKGKHVFFCKTIALVVERRYIYIYIFVSPRGKSGFVFFAERTTGWLTVIKIDQYHIQG